MHCAHGTNTTPSAHLRHSLLGRNQILAQALRLLLLLVDGSLQRALQQHGWGGFEAGDGSGMGNGMGWGVTEVGNCSLCCMRTAWGGVRLKCGNGSLSCTQASCTQASCTQAPHPAPTVLRPMACSAECAARNSAMSSVKLARRRRGSSASASLRSTARSTVTWVHNGLGWG